MTFEHRAEMLKARAPDLIADVEIYPADSSPRKGPLPPGFGCLCVTSKEPPVSGWDCWLMLGDEPMQPGDKRRIGFVFLSGEEAAAALRGAGTFWLWDGGAIGDARVGRFTSPGQSGIGIETH